MQDEILTPEQETEIPQETLPEKVTVADIHFRSGNKVYFFDPGELELKAGDHVIMETARGLEFGYCSGGNHVVSSSEIVPPLRKILRIATEKDERTNEENIQKEKKAFEICQQKIQAHGLDMQLVSAECAFDGSKILFFFTADGRVDFRELVKNLASVFRTRIELRQIGVRDKAKMVGGLGICGRPFCCKEFLDDFHPVSIKMAKTQNLSLNPTKISGTCGRLMCCLKYEQEAYEDLLKTSPKAESLVDTVDGRGTIVDVNLLRQSVRVRMEDQPEQVNCYKNCDICVLRSGKAKKTDAPIPKEVAPLSSKPKPARRLADETPVDPMPEVVIASEVKAEKVRIEEPKAEGTKTGSSNNRKRKKKKPASQQPKAEAAPKAAEPKAEKPKADKPRPQKPAEPKAEAAPKAEGAAKPVNHNHRRRRRRPSGPKPGGNAPAAE
jgi:cell fate regulator YaaT (PSP1 superfamily)